MNREVKDILSKGLMEGYMGHSPIMPGERAGFPIEMTDYPGPGGKHHDEWAADYNGGGQELGEAMNGEQGTRLYGGGTLPKEELDKLGLTKEGVLGKLIFFINESQGKTRLEEEIRLTDGDWEYSYQILKQTKELDLTAGDEIIRYKSTLVFEHLIIFSPVK